MFPVGNLKNYRYRGPLESSKEIAIRNTNDLNIKLLKTKLDDELNQINTLYLAIENNCNSNYLSFIKINNHI